MSWGVIRLLEMVGWAKVRKTAPQLKLGAFDYVVKPCPLDELPPVHRRLDARLLAGGGRREREEQREEVAHGPPF